MISASAARASSQANSDSFSEKRLTEIRNYVETLILTCVEQGMFSAWLPNHKLPEIIKAELETEGYKVDYEEYRVLDGGHTTISW